ncbi:MAG: DNA recombination protein RmuC [SAR86 cluster bacterium]|uniref:DNA recombination protein RmuC n=1 Tax=SAR86 cluster bacterium TaxID=2030880 RepID=A0A2A5BBA7_9GAMM|nr:MAG: DNA recombination protein RmuC [SAR86 cluster bacterium]
MIGIEMLLLGIPLIVAVVIVFILLSQSQRLKLAELSSRERLSAKETELHKTLEALEKAQTDNDALKNEVQLHREQKASLATSLDLERKQFEEKLTLLDESKEQLTIAFKNIANEIFEDKSKKFVANNKESLATVLNPLQDKIQQFEKRVEETYDKESKERFSLAKEIKNLQELNSKISEDAVNLTNALKGDNKAQGSWGEFILESVLEKSGLVKGREYEVQVSLKAEDGSKFQPDVVVHLPESRDIIIDSKVSLKAWDAFCSSDNEESKSDLLKQHIQSIRQHVKSLSGKDYQKLEGVNSLDYVFLFMPIEAAYSIAIQNDPELNHYAFDRNIIFVGPTTLLTTLKTVQNLWRLAQQNKNATEIAKQAGALYDKFVGFVEDLDEIGLKIDASKKSFDKAHNKLHSGRGNLIKRVETLKQLGAKTSKKQKTESLDVALDADKDSIAAPISDSDQGEDENTRH